MRNVQTGMNVAKQRRKIEVLAAGAQPSHLLYLIHLLAQFDAQVAAGTPQPASQFIPMYREEFGL